MAKSCKEYKKLRLLLLPVGRWVGLLKRSISNTILKTTTPGKAFEASRNHQDRQTYRKTDGPKIKKPEGGGSEKAPEEPYTAVTTQGQLRALEKDATAQGGVTCRSKALASEASPRRENPSDKTASDPTTKAILDKDASGRDMTDWEYLMWLHHNSPIAGHPGPKCILELLIRSPEFTKSSKLA